MLLSTADDFEQVAGVGIAGRSEHAHGIAPVQRGHPAYEDMRDGEGDGVVREG